MTELLALPGCGGLTASLIQAPLFIVYVHEMSADLAALQGFLDRSYVTAGRHLLRIITAQRRLRADEVADRLTGRYALAGLGDRHCRCATDRRTG